MSKSTFLLPGNFITLTILSSNIRVWVTLHYNLQGYSLNLIPWPTGTCEQHRDLFIQKDSQIYLWQVPWPIQSRWHFTFLIKQYPWACMIKRMWAVLYLHFIKCLIHTDPTTDCKLYCIYLSSRNSHQILLPHVWQIVSYWYLSPGKSYLHPLIRRRRGWV